MNGLIYSKENPGRPPDWRWRKAAWLRESGKYVRSNEDQETLVIKDYQMKKAKVKNDVDEWAVYSKYPGLHWAEHIRENLDMTRYTIEARLLANEPIADIAEKTGCIIDAVIWYEKAFFNVLPYLTHKDYIVNSVMGESVHAGLSHRQYDLLWKMLAYSKGPLILDEYLTKFSQNHVTDADQVKLTMHETLREILLNKSLTAGMLAKTDFEGLSIIELYNRFTEVEKTNGADGSAQTVIINNINSSLRKLPVSLDRDKVATPQLTYYDETSAELRADEMLSASAGKKLAIHDMVAGLKFPEGAKDGLPTKDNQGN